MSDVLIQTPDTHKQTPEPAKQTPDAGKQMRVPVQQRGGFPKQWAEIHIYNSEGGKQSPEAAQTVFGPAAEGCIDKK